MIGFLVRLVVAFIVVSLLMSLTRFLSAGVRRSISAADLHRGRKNSLGQASRRARAGASLNDITRHARARSEDPSKDAIDVPFRDVT